MNPEIRIKKCLVILNRFPESSGRSEVVRELTASLGEIEKSSLIKARLEELKEEVKVLHEIVDELKLGKGV